MSDIIDNKDTHYQVMMGSYTVEEFVNQIDDAYNNEGKETKKGILIAPFQRAYQWHQEEHPLYFLDSLNSNIFVMPVILVEHMQQTWIIDGQQRLATLYCYIKKYQPKNKNPIEWKELIIAIKNENLDIVKPCEWAELEGVKFDRDKILQTPIGYSFLFNVNHKDNPRLLVEIFDRINNQGIKLQFSETVRAYGWLYPDIQKIIDKIYSFQYHKNLVIYNGRKADEIVDVFINMVFSYVTYIHEFHTNNYKVNFNFFNPPPEKFVKQLAIDKEKYNLYIPIINWFLDNWVLIDKFVEDNESCNIMFDQHSVMTRRYSEIPCMVGQYYFQYNKFPTESSLNKLRKLLRESLINIIHPKDFQYGLLYSFQYENTYRIYKQSMEDE